MFITSARAPSVYMVLSLGALSGGVVKGITGFGNAIINLLVWVAFTAASVDSGPLQLAVLADSFGCVVCSIPLLLMTAAHKTADWRLVIAILMFTSAGAPLGAVLLTRLPVRWVELAMGCVLLLVICLQVKLHVTLCKRFDKWRASRGSADSLAAGAAHHDSIAADTSRAGASTPSPSPGNPKSPLPSPAALGPASRGCEAPAGPEGHDDDNAVDPAATKAAVDCGEATIVITCCSASIEDPAAVNRSPSPPVDIHAGDAAQSASSLRRQRGAEGCGVETAAAAVLCPGVVADTAPLLEPSTLASDATAPRRAAGCARGVFKGPLGARLRRCVERQDWKEMQRILIFGSVAGFASGFMGGMTGIGGPPLMFMYERLQVAKDVVRGTNAVNNVLQARLVSYVVMGVFKREDLMLYGITSAAGLAGVFFGNALAGRLDQRGFSRVLVGLMVVCCALLFASAAGLKGHPA